MNFEIISEITEVKTIAVGSGIRDRARLRKVYGKVAGERLRAWRQFACGVVGFGWRSYIGMKHTALAAKK